MLEPASAAVRTVPTRQIPAHLLWPSSSSRTRLLLPVAPPPAARALAGLGTTVAAAAAAAAGSLRRRRRRLALGRVSSAAATAAPSGGHATATRCLPGGSGGNGWSLLLLDSRGGVSRAHLHPLRGRPAEVHPGVGGREEGVTSSARLDGGGRVRVDGGRHALFASSASSSSARGAARALHGRRGQLLCCRPGHHHAANAVMIVRLPPCAGRAGSLGRGVARANSTRCSSCEQRRCGGGAKAHPGDEAATAGERRWRDVHRRDELLEIGQRRMLLLMLLLLLLR